MPQHIIDTHTHIHPSWDIKIFLDHTKKNFDEIAGGEKYTGILFLTELMDSHILNALKTTDFDPWKIHLTQENFCLIAKKKDAKIILIMGKQIVSSEHLEVLAIGTTATCEPGKTTKEVIQWAKKHKALIILPWGVGKWLGRRKYIIKSILKETKPDQVFLGDNGNRPTFWQYVSLFRYAQKKGFTILNGSDPLPLETDIDRAGSFGIMMDVTLSKETPGSDLLNILKNIQETKEPVAYYGKLSSFYQFLTNQIRIRR